MEKWLKKATFSDDSINAIFIITLISAYILSKFFIGFSIFAYLGAILISAVIALAYPKSGVYAIIFLTFIWERFFTLDSIIWGRSEIKLYPLDILMGVVILSIIFKLIKNYLFPSKTPAIVWPRFRKADYLLTSFIILSGLIFAVSVFFQRGDFALAFSSLKAYAFYPIWYFIILFLFQKPSDQKRLLQFALAGGIFLIFFVVLGLARGEGLWTEYTPLSTSGTRTLAFTHAFYLSLVSLMALPFVFSQKEKSVKKIWFLVGALWVIGIVGSLMRHLWLSVIVSLMAVWFILEKEKRQIFQKYVWRGVGGALITSVMVLYFSQLFLYSPIHTLTRSVTGVVSDRAQSFTSGATDESFVWRKEMWKSGLKEYLKNPLTGVGFGKMFSIEMGSYHSLVEARNIHNSPLSLMVQTGLLGLGIFLWLLWAVFRPIWDERRESWINFSLIAGLTFYFLASLFQPYFEANMLAIFFWIILGLMRARNI